MPAIDLNQVIQRLFSNGRTRKRFCGDFGIEDIGSAKDLASTLVESLCRIPPENYP